MRSSESSHQCSQEENLFSCLKKKEKNENSAFKNLILDLPSFSKTEVCISHPLHGLT